MIIPPQSRYDSWSVPTLIQHIREQDATIAALVEALEEFIPADSTAHTYDKARAALKAAKEGAR